MPMPSAWRGDDPEPILVSEARPLRRHRGAWRRFYVWGGLALTALALVVLLALLAQRG